MTQIQDHIRSHAPENATPLQRPSDLYSEIELTQEEVEWALAEARSKKSAAIKLEEYRKELTKEIKPVRYTYGQLLKYIYDLDDFVVDEDNAEVVDLLCRYFSEDKSFENFFDPNGRKYSLSKGILLFGSVGVGKTRLMELFRNNQKASYIPIACQDVEACYAKNGPDRNETTGEWGLSRYFGLVTLTSRNQYGQEYLGFMFDDLGQENASTKYFGTERNVMQEVLSQRYKNNLHENTHLTTNLSGDQITATYGIRVADRMREMFNLIVFPKTAKSRRK